LGYIGSGRKSERICSSVVHNQFSLVAARLGVIEVTFDRI